MSHITDTSTVWVVEYNDACGGQLDALTWDVFVDFDSATKYIDDGYADTELPFWGDDGISHPRLFAVTDWPTPVSDTDGHITSIIVDATITVLDHHGQLDLIAVDPDASNDELHVIRGKRDWSNYWRHRWYGRPDVARAIERPASVWD